jgi:hypothetical protein
LALAMADDPGVDEATADDAVVAGDAAVDALDGVVLAVFPPQPVTMSIVDTSARVRQDVGTDGRIVITVGLPARSCPSVRVRDATPRPEVATSGTCRPRTESA